MWFVTVTHHTPYNTHHTGWDSICIKEERLFVHKELITAWTCIICNHFNKRTVLLLLFHEHYVGGLHKGNFFFMVSLYVDDRAVIAYQHLSLLWCNVCN